MTGAWIETINIYHKHSHHFRRETTWLSCFAGPYKMLRYPAVIWGAAITGITLGWAIIIQVAFGDFFPVLYNFSGYAVGNINYAVGFRPQNV